MSTIVLKDKANADVTFTLSGISGNSVIYDNKGDSLLNRKRITLSLNENKSTNRIAIKLSVPSVCEATPGCDVPSIKYTQVASADISVVKFSTKLDREDLQAMFDSLISSTAVVNLVENGVLPS